MYDAVVSFCLCSADEHKHVKLKYNKNHRVRSMIKNSHFNRTSKQRALQYNMAVYRNTNCVPIKPFITN